MASLSRRLLDIRVLTASLTQEDSGALDAGAYNTLQIQIRVVKAGSAGNVKLQHAAVLEPDAWLDVPTSSVGLGATGNVYTSIPNFLRYIRWVTDASVAGDPLVVIDIVAKE